jgi:hypothetical protein
VNGRKVRSEGEATSPCQSAFAVGCAALSTTLDRETVQFSLRSGCSGWLGSGGSRPAEGYGRHQGEYLEMFAVGRSPFVVFAQGISSGPKGTQH